ncbi:MAG: competence/damage-inducible protein A [Acidobacteriota bacterium]
MKTESLEAEIIAVGTELLTSSRIETNSLFLAGKLNELGILVSRKVVVGDWPERIAAALRAAMGSSQIVMFTGGLGPTSDDITREVVAETLSRTLRLDSTVVEDLETRYHRFGFKMTDNNLRQAMVPAGAQVLKNGKGTAPGLFLKEGEVLIFLLPGPPRELRPMTEEQVIPLIRKHKRSSPRPFRRLRVASLAESHVDSRVEPLYRAYPQIETTILSSPGVVDLFFSWRGQDDGPAKQQLDELDNRVRQELGVSIFSDQDEALEGALGRILRQKNLTLATAESCTGGLVSKLITDVPGSSDYFLGGVVGYSNGVKNRLLGVDQSSLDGCGAVSREVAIEMAAGACREVGADLGLSITGIAGPDGGTRDKPVGTVFFGLFDRGRAQVKQRQMPGDRETIRLRSARFGLDWLRRHLL